MTFSDIYFFFFTTYTLSFKILLNRACVEFYVLLKLYYFKNTRAHTHTHIPQNIYTFTSSTYVITRNMSNITVFLRVKFTYGHRVLTYLQTSTSPLLMSMHSIEKYSTIETTSSRSILTNRRISDNAIVV